MYSIDSLIDVLSKLRRSNVDFVIIGSTVVQLALKREQLEEDVDLFVLRPSPVAEEEFYRELANRYAWSVSFTELGTPRIIAKSSTGDELVLELYENIYDFYVPEDVLNAARKLKLRGESVRVLSLEDYILLKAKAGRDDDIQDLNIIREHIKAGRLKVDKRLIEKRTRLFGDEANVIRRRLEAINLLE